MGARAFFLFPLCLLIVNLGLSQKARKYKSKLDPNSKLVQSGANFTLEQIQDTVFVLKRYYPDNQMITHRVTFNSPECQIKNGLYIHRYDDGTLVSKGKYLNNEKQGFG